MGGWTPPVELSPQEQRIAKVLERTVEIAKRTNKFGWQHLEAALDSSPLLGAR